MVKVPGSWELPVVVRELARQKRHDAIICLAAVIRGDTPHFDYVAGEAVKGIGHAAAESGVPVAFGVLTCNTLEQAIDRAGAKSGNKGFDAAMAAIEMANLMRQLRAQARADAVPPPVAPEGLANSLLVGCAPAAGGRSHRRLTSIRCIRKRAAPSRSATSFWTSW